MRVDSELGSGGGAAPAPCACGSASWACGLPCGRADCCAWPTCSEINHYQGVQLSARLKTFSLEMYAVRLARGSPLQNGHQVRRPAAHALLHRPAGNRFLGTAIESPMPSWACQQVASPHAQMAAAACRCLRRPRRAAPPACPRSCPCPAPKAAMPSGRTGTTATRRTRPAPSWAWRGATSCGSRTPTTRTGPARHPTPTRGRWR